MKVTLEFSAVLDVKNFANGDSVSLDEGSTIGDLITLAGIRPEHRRYVVSLLNGREVRHEQELADGDEVFLLVLASGG